MTFNLPFGAIGATFRVGFSVFSDNYAIGANQYWLAILDNIGTVQLYLRWNASKQIELRRGDNTLLATGTKILQNNSWYYVEFLATIDDVLGSASLQIDGAPQFSIGPVDTRNGGNATMGGFILRGDSGSTYWSDLFVADAGPLVGEQRVLLLTPNADGAASAWTPSTGVALWSLVDEIPPNGDTDYISSATPGQEALFAFTDLPYTPANVYGVQTSLYARKDDAGVREIAALVRSGGTTNIGATQALSSSYLDIYLRVDSVNPITTAAWTPAEVNALEAGVRCIT